MLPFTPRVVTDFITSLERRGITLHIYKSGTVAVPTHSAWTKRDAETLHTYLEEIVRYLRPPLTADQRLPPIKPDRPGKLALPDIQHQTLVVIIPCGPFTARCYGNGQPREDRLPSMVTKRVSKQQSKPTVKQSGNGLGGPPRAA